MKNIDTLRVVQEHAVAWQSQLRFRLYLVLWARRISKSLGKLRVLNISSVKVQQWNKIAWSESVSFLDGSAELVCVLNCVAMSVTIWCTRVVHVHEWFFNLLMNWYEFTDTIDTDTFHLSIVDYKYRY